MKFRQITKSDTYNRWESTCGIYAIAWYYWKNDNKKISVDPRYIPYKSSNRLKGWRTFTTFEAAAYACELDEKNGP